MVRRLVVEDNLVAMRRMRDESVDLIYLDPPFNSGRDYRFSFNGPRSLKSRARLSAFADTWSWDDGCEAIYSALTDTQNGDESHQNLRQTIIGLIGILGKGEMSAYLLNVAVRLTEMRRITRPTATIYLHCDPTASHYLKLLMDAVFGSANFRNEIVWAYRGGGVPRRDFARKHDVILRYSKSDNYTFHPQYVEYSDASRNLVTSRGGVSIDDRARDLERGAHMPDWWSDINSLQTWSPERTGYPTQKPLRLLERIVRASTNEGDVVLDPFSGCGTTLLAAENLARQWIGIDVEPMALHFIRARFQKAKLDLDFEVSGITSLEASDAPRWQQLAETSPSKFARAAIGLVDGCVPWRDHPPSGGIDGIVTFPTGPGESGYAIVRVIGGRYLGTELVREFAGDVEAERDGGVTAGVLICAQEPNTEMNDTAQSAGQFAVADQSHPRLCIVSVGELLRRKRDGRPALPLPTSDREVNGHRSHTVAEANSTAASS